jgi:hypothetical protein
MSRVSQPNIKLPRYLSRSVVAALVIGLGGLALIWRATGDASSAGAVGREVGAVLLTTAVLLGAYEPYLRKQIIKDVFRAADLREDMAAVGLANVGIGAPSWEGYMADKTQIILLPDNPVTWINSGIWSAILARARAARIDVQLYLPDWTSQKTVAALAQRLGEADQTRLQQSLETNHSAAVSLWRVPTEGLSLHRGSKLSPHLYNGVPGNGIVIADRSAVVMIPGSYNSDPAERPVVLTFELETSHETELWLQGLLNGLGATAHPSVEAP